jgi:hypothetical protein
MTIAPLASTDASDTSPAEPVIAHPAPNRAWLRTWLPYAAVTLAAVLLRGSTISNRIYSLDELSYLAQAARLHSVEAFVYAFAYRVDVKSQVSLIPFLLAQIVSPSDPIPVVRIAGVVAVALTGFLLVALARRVQLGAALGAGAALVWMLYLNTGGPLPLDPVEFMDFFVGVRLEYFQAPAILGSVYLLLAGLRAPGGGLWSLAGAGLLCSVAILVKPSAGLLIPVGLGALVFAGRDGRGTVDWIKAVVPRVAAFLIGVVSPLFLWVLPYFFNESALAELRFNLLDVNGSYIQGYPLHLRVLHLLLSLPLSVLVALAVGLMAGWRRISRPLAVLLASGVAVFGGYLGSGFLLPYYGIAVAPLLALAGLGLLARTACQWRGSPVRRWGLALAPVLICLLAQLPTVAEFYTITSRDGYLAEERARFDLDAVVHLVRTTTKPGSAIWVYYNAPEIYTLTGRFPATRDPVGSWISGFSREPWFTRTAMDLAAEQPDLLIGIADPRYHQVAALPLTQIPEVADLIARDYRCDAERLRGVTICRRLGLESLSPDR